MRLSTGQRRFGFTLLELLVVIGIIGILLAMFVPAIRSTREAARRATCSNNIRQLMLTIHNYSSAHRQMPQAMGISPQAKSNMPSTTDRYSGFLSFFNFSERYSGPYFDEEVVSNGVTYPAYPDVNTTGYPLFSEQRLGYLCPNIPVNESEFGSVHYAFSIGDVARNVHSPNAIRGAFAVGRAQSFDDLTDGTSNTIGLAEIGGVADRTTGRRFAINQPARYLENPSGTSELVDSSNNYKSSVELSPKFRGGNWADGTGGPGLVNTILPPGSPSLLVGGISAVDGFYSASENHPGGTMIALCDGSSHFIGNDIDAGDQKHRTGSAEELDGLESHYGVWGALGSSNGSETVEGEY